MEEDTSSPASIAPPTFTSVHNEGRATACYLGDGSERQLVTAGADRRLAVRTFASGAAPTNISTCQGSLPGYHAIACNAAGTQAVACDDQYVKLYTLPDLEETAIASRFQMPPRAVAYSRDGTMVAAAGDDGIVKVISVSDQKVLKQHKWEGYVRSVAFDPEGTFVAAVQADGCLLVMDWAANKVVKKHVAPRGHPDTKHLSRPDWHPDGGILLAVPGTEHDVVLYERMSWSPTGYLAGGHTEHVNCTAFSPNGRYIATAGLDQVLLIWEVDGCKCVARCELGAVATSITWHPGANEIAVATEVGSCGLLPEPVPKELRSPWKSAEQEEREEEELAAGTETGKRPAEPEDSEGGGDSFIVDEEDVARRAAARKRRKVALEAAAAAIMPRISLAELAPKAQGPLQPGATSAAEAEPGRSARFLAYDLLGCIISRDMGGHNSIEVQLHDVTAMRKRVPLRTDYLGLALGALSPSGVMYASHASGDVPSMILYRPFEARHSNSEWTAAMPEGEDAQCIACGASFAAVATSGHMLRIFSLGGTQVFMLALPAAPVALAARDGLLAVVHHAPGGPALADGSQVLQYCVYDVAGQALVQQGPLPLSKRSTLTWLGFDDEGALATQDSEGVVRLYGCEFGGCWVPVFVAASQRKTPQEHFWLVGLAEGSAYCIITSTAQPQPQLAPKPIIQALPLSLPVAVAEGSSVALESDLLRASMQVARRRQAAQQYSSCPGADPSEVAHLEDCVRAAVNEVDRCCLKLLQAALKADRQTRASELVDQLGSYVALQGALRLVNHHRKAELADHVTQRLQESLQMEAGLCAAQTAAAATAAAATAAVPAPAAPVPAALSPSLPKQFAAAGGEEEEEQDGAGQQDQRQQQDQQQERPAAARPAAAKPASAAFKPAAALGGGSKAAGGSNPFARRSKAAKS